MTAYADTSFIVSIYVLDANSRLAAARMKRISLPILITLLGELELSNALSLRLFRKELTPFEVEAAHGLFAEDVSAGLFQPSPLAPAAYERAALIARKHTPQLGTRTLDVLHVALALTLNASTFYTFDRNQRVLAKREGLATP